MININVNVLIILVAFMAAMMAIGLLYAIIISKGTDSKDKDFQLTTKNILEHVKTLFDKGEYALVQLLAIKYLERMPSHKEVRRYLAEAYYRDGKYNNAIKQCLIVLKREPNHVNTRKILGECYIKKDMLSKAIKEFEDIFEQRNNDKEIVRTLAELYKDTEQIYSAIAVYNILTDLVNDNDEMAEIQGILAKLNEQAHNYPAAFEAYKNRLDIYPNDYDTNKDLVELYIKLKNYTKATEVLLYMLSFVIEPKGLLWVFEQLVAIYVETEDYEKAIEYSNKLLDVQGSDKFKVRNDIATFNLKLNNFDAGISLLEELVMMSQSAFGVTVQLAKAYIEQKEFDKALEKYTALLDKSTQKEAKDVRALICEMYIEWADNLAKNGDYEGASSMLDKASDFNALNPEIYYHRAVNSYNNRNYAASVEQLHRALEYDKFNDFHAKYLLKLSEAHHEQGDFFEEKKALSDLLKIDPGNSMGLYRSGLMYVSQHDTKNAEDCFLHALESDPDLTAAKYNLALIYESNNREKAKELYMEILEDEPTNQEAKNALAELSSSDY